MDYSKFKVLSFDCYGTLIDWETGILHTLRPWLSDNGCELNDDLVLEAFAKAESDAEREQPALPYPDILRDVVDRLAPMLEVPATPAQRETLATSVANWPAFADSPGALAELAGRYQLAILSNVDNQSFAGSNARLGVSFDLVLTAEDIGSYKPDLANFHALLAALAERGIERHELLHVAQSLHHDIEPARQLDLACVWIDRRGPGDSYGATMPPRGEVSADATFRSMAAFASATRA